MKIKLLIFLLFSTVMIAQSSFDRAEKLYSENKLSDAKRLFEDYLNSNPSHSKTIEYLGDISGKEKKWDEAISYYKKLKDKFPSTANYHYKFGGAMGMKAKNANKFKALGMIDDIETAFLTAAKLDEKHIDTRWALVMLYIELPGIIGGSETKAQKYASQLMNLSKVDGYLSKGYIDVYFERYSKAEANYKKAHEIGNSKTTYEKLYDLYLNKMKNKTKASQLKEEYNK
jgi:tetratricopeptide (TPR) repeat protein